MSRTLRAGWACALAVLAAGCQDYNFNPVGHCVIQPGTKRVTLSSISSADVLFVVDDSGSMGGEQAKLASNFTSFIDNLDDSNAARAAAGLQPFDFHIAVTTTSVFWNYQTATTCSSSCTGAAGQLVCCKTDGTPAKQPRRCGSAADCAGLAGTTCGTNCTGFKGEGVCCAADGSFPVGSVAATIPCSREGIMCGTLETHYDFGTCDAGVAVDEWPYPKGEFVSWASASKANPRVLHFDKELYGAAAANKQGFTRGDLISFFAGGTAAGAAVQGNVKVGTCGSGEEQALQAARLAIEKARSSDPATRQKDTYARTSTTPDPKWDPAKRIGLVDADWLAGQNSKLVLVFVGDEDDCSAPQDPSGGVVMLAEPAGADACTRDADTAAPLGHKEYTVDAFADYFTGLGRPVGAAFIFPAAQNSCAGDTCTAGPGVCCATDCPGTIGVCTNNTTCGAQAPGKRLLDTANALRTRGADVVLGSICDSNFGTLLNSIAELVKPPTGLTLPSQPAEDDVTVLRIADTSGQTRKVCGRPLAPATYPSLLAAQQTGADWWFTAVPDVMTVTAQFPQPWNPVAASPYVYINPLGACIANPGETYSADYLGKLPGGGCGNDPAAEVNGVVGPMTGDEMCARLLGGAAGSWTCYGGLDSASGRCVATTGLWGDGSNPTGTGTCLCGSAAVNCPAGRLP